ncbi:hypothetical protein AeRB84_020468 [Aphanomyces euteiches]|nr:hypothetical protein AeRB84_020468 [Aphanomyces euteiches]
MNFIDLFVDDDTIEQVVAIMDEDDLEQLSWGASRFGRAPAVDRRRELYDQLLYDDYWGPSPIYDHTYFKKHFKLPIELFDEIHERAKAHDAYFEQKPDAVGKLVILSLSKIACAIRQLTSGVSPNELDDKYRMAPSTGLES